MHLLYRFVNNKKYILAVLLVATMLSSAIVLRCKSDDGGRSNPGGNPGGVTVPFNGSGLLPSGVTANINGDSYDCMMNYDSSCINYSCDLDCMAAYMTAESLLDPESADYETQVAALEAEMESCQIACYNGCDMESVFLIKISVTNTTSETVTITLPAGLTFVPGSTSYQPMMTIKTITITVTASQTVTMCIPVFCLDVEAHAPDEDAGYTGYTTIDSASACLQSIITALENVDYSTLGYPDYSKIQDIIWSCTSEGSISTEEQAFLDALPKTGAKKMKRSSVLAKKKFRYYEVMQRKLKLLK